MAKHYDIVYALSPRMWILYLCLEFDKIIIFDGFETKQTAK